MDLKNLPLSDQLPYAYCSSPRRKVVSRFGSAMVISMILLTLVVYNVSYRAPFLDSVWQGFHYNSTSPLSFWSFSSSQVYNISSINGNNNNNTLEKLEPFAIRNEKNGNISSMDDSGGKKEVVASENAQLGNGQNGDATLEGFLGVAPVTSPVSEIDKNVTFNNNNNRNNGQENVTAEGNNSLDSSKVVSNDSSSHQQGAKPNSFYGDCDIFHGRWVRDDSLKPYYPPGSCPYIDRDFDCHLNKRPDIDYVKWKWQPHGCDIPSLNGTDFLERIRGQKLVFVGDSLNRNMWESLICILRHSVPDKEKVYEITGRTEFKKGGFYSFRYEDYNCSVDFVSSPFLVQESSYDRGNGSFDTLRLDLMDEATSMYEDADIIIFNTAHWWTHEKTSRGEDYYQEGDHVHGRLKVLEAYKRAIYTWARWVDKHINHNKTRVIFRGYSGVHFSGGQWNSGGQCHKETEPIYDERHLEKYPRKMKALEYVLQDMKTPVIYLNISMLTEFRKDAHPSIYRKEYKTIEEKIAGEQSQDCSHWCLPGVPDTWNELLYASLLKAAGR